MQDLRTLLLALCTALLCAIFVPGARAGEWEKTTIATFNVPVEVPGQVLPAGRTYFFKLADSPSDRHIVQVWNQNQDHLIATIQAIPDYRPQPTDEPVFYFEERPGNSPEAIREWFYPGDYYGQEFVYSESRPAGLAATAYTHVPAMPNDATSNATNGTVDQPSPPNPATDTTENSQQPVSTDQSQATQSQVAPSTDQSQTSQQQTKASTSPDDSNKELPKTASPIPLIGLIGTLSLAGAFGLREFAKRMS
jgi:hypothetical protein